MSTASDWAYIGALVMNYDIKSWKLQEIQELLEHSGYGVDDLLDARFSHVSASDPAVCVFTVSYEDTESQELEHGRVYVSIRNGRICADY